MTDQTSKIRIKFRCDQDIDNMTIDTDGKPFCEMCQKSLVDFRLKSLKEVVNYTKEKKEVCGILKAEHVVEDNVVDIITLSGIKRMMLVFTTLFITEIAYAQNLETSNLKTETIIQENEEVDTENEEVECIKEIRTESTKIKKYKSKSYKIYGFFVSRRFPFIRFRKKIYQDTGLRHGSLMW